MQCLDERQQTFSQHLPLFLGKGGSREVAGRSCPCTWTTGCGACRGWIARWEQWPLEVYLYGEKVLFILIIAKLCYQKLISGSSSGFKCSSPSSVRESLYFFLLSIFTSCVFPETEVWSTVNLCNLPTLCVSTIPIRQSLHLWDQERFIAGLEIINADVQNRLVTIVKHFCVPNLIMKCVNSKSFIVDRPRFKF